MACEPSVLPLSATITSPSIPAASSARSALPTQVATVSASLRHGMTTDTSGRSREAPTRGGIATAAPTEESAGEDDDVDGSATRIVSGTSPARTGLSVWEDSTSTPSKNETRVGKTRSESRRGCGEGGGRRRTFGPWVHAPA